MAKLSKRYSIRMNIGTLLFSLIAVAAGGFGSRTLAQDRAASDKVYVVTHVDIIPPQAAAGTKLVQQYIVDTRKDPGLVRIEAASEISRGNHISIMEVWQDKKALDEHVAAGHTRQFRQQLDPMLGSPYDERLHHNLE
jgi:quinol monooxygenase YgiN